MSQESVLRMIAYTAKMISSTASSKADISLFHAKVKMQLFIIVVITTLLYSLLFNRHHFKMVADYISLSKVGMCHFM